MSGPWEKYAKPDAAPKPWEKYQLAPATPAAAVDMRSPQAAALLDAGVPEQDVRNAIAKSPTYGDAPEGYFLDPRTGGMTSRDGMKRNVQTDPMSAAGDGYLQGASLGTMDEVAGAVGYLEGGPSMANLRREQARARFEAQREAHPTAYTGGTFTGAVLSPVNKVIPGSTSVRGAAATGGGAAAVEAFNEGEGSFLERAREMPEAALFGAVAAGAGKTVVDFGTKGFRRLYHRGREKPTVDKLKVAKTQAYRDVDKAGEVFSGDEVFDMVANIEKRLDAEDYVPGYAPKTDGVVAKLQKTALRDQPVTLSRLDKIRSRLWKAYSSAEDEVEILEAIDEIDNLIASRGDSSDLMKAARLANARYRKAELIDATLRKAELQTAGSGTGGNLTNKYRQAITSIVTNPKKAKWFSGDEIKLMEQFVEGSNAENALRLAGRISPDSGGLMLAMNLFAAGLDPMAVAASGAGYAAKGTADRLAKKKAYEIFDTAATGVLPSAARVPMRPNALVGLGVTASNLRRPQ